MERLKTEGCVMRERVTTTEDGSRAGEGKLAKNHQNKVGCAFLNNEKGNLDAVFLHSKAHFILFQIH